MYNINSRKIEHLLEETVNLMLQLNSKQAQDKVFEFVKSLGKLRANKLKVKDSLSELSVRVGMPLKAFEFSVFLNEYKNSYMAEGSKILKKEWVFVIFMENIEDITPYLEYMKLKVKKKFKISYSFFLENEKRDLSIKECKEYVERLKAIALLNEDEINLHEKEGMIKVKNGLYSLGINSLHSHIREHFATSCIATEYYRDEDCPKWKKFLEETFSLLKGQEKEMAINLLQEFMGYSLLPGNEYQKCLFLLGKPRTGKSVILNVWEEIIGTKNVSNIPLEELNQETKIGELLGKHINVSGELERGKKINTTFLKSLIGEDRVMGRNLYKNPFYFKNKAKLVIAGNYLPNFDDISGAMLERSIILNLNNVIPSNKRDPNLTKKLLEEKEGILKWMLEGLKRLKTRGYFLETGTSIEMKEAIEFKSNSIIYWWKECSENIFKIPLQKSEYSKKILFKVALNNYKDFCEMEEIKSEKRKTFKEVLSEIENIKIFRDSKLNQDLIELILKAKIA